MLRFISIFVLLLVSCNRGFKKEVPLENLKISIREKIKRSLDEEYLSELGMNASAGRVLAAYYEHNDFQPRWIKQKELTAEGAALKKILQNPLQFGIPVSRYSSLNWKESTYLKDELLITATLAYLAHDLKTGFLQPDTLLLKPLLPVSVSFLEKISRFDSDTLKMEEQLLMLGPADSNYRQLAVGLLDYCQYYPLDTNSFKVESIKKDSLFAEKKAKISLVSKGYLEAEDSDSVQFHDALTLFQEHNGLKPDAVIGNYTAKALSESTVHKLMRTALVMEKWRWKATYPKKHIRINVPEYRLRLCIDDTLRSTHRIIVGKNETRTPELEAIVRQIVVYPYWTVPQSISNKEILPKVKQNVNYLARNNYRIFRKDEEVDPTTVNWSKYRDHFPFKVRQDPGPSNSLGIIKFEFHNRFGVYVHDTPNKNLFNADIRSFSHGCMRCENPVGLAKMILEKDSVRSGRNEITPLLLDSLIGLAENYKIDLKDPIPIFVEYKTVTVDKGRIIFHPDIYGRDEKYLELME